MAHWKVTEWRKNTKRKLIEGFGGCCNKCGYSEYDGALDFHHLDETTKEFGISEATQNPRSWNSIVKEAKKCIMLCNRCHAELHGNVWSINDIQVRSFLGNETLYKKDVVTGECPICGKEVYLDRICCSKQCAAKRAQKISWPNTEELKSMLATHSRSQVAKILHVSEMAVRKREKKLGLLA